MGRELKDTIKHECSPLEKAVAPVPTVIFDDVMGFSLHPQIESDKGDSTRPSAML